jgi:tRNA threonylcarbamoyladenosine biosynthesis protein TsaE
VNSDHHNQPPTKITIALSDEGQTTEFGRVLSSAVRPGLTIYLRGNLGAGKTTLVRGLLRGLGFRGKVKSPTFALVEVYAISRLNLYHIDLYRFTNPAEWRDSGFREYFDGESVCIVEWPERAGGLLPSADVEIVFEILEHSRRIEIFTRENSVSLCLKQFQESPAK